VDHLLNLDEEFDFADAAAPPLEVESRAEARALCEMVADSRRDLAHLVDHAEVERAPPHERLDRAEEALAERDVAGAGFGADEGGALPRQRRGFVMGDRGVDRQRNWRDFGRRTQAQIDPRDIAVGGPFLQQFDQPAPDSDRGFASVIARAPRQGFGIEQQQQIDVGRIIEFAAAELAHGDDREPMDFGVGHPLADRGLDRAVDCAVGEAAEQTGDGFERELPGKVAKCDGERQREPLPPQLYVERCGRRGQREFGGILRTSSLKGLGNVGARAQRFAQERGETLRPRYGVLARSGGRLRIHRRLNAAIPRHTKLPQPLGRFPHE